MLTVVPDRIESKIFFIRGKKVMLDRDLATLYGVEREHSIRQLGEIQNDSLLILCFS